MTEKELINSKIKAIKQWLWVLNNYEREELGLPNWMSKQNAIDEALDELLELNEKLKNLENEK